MNHCMLYIQCKILMQPKRKTLAAVHKIKSCFSLSLQAGYFCNITWLVNGSKLFHAWHLLLKKEGNMWLISSIKWLTQVILSVNHVSNSLSCYVVGISSSQFIVTAEEVCWQQGRVLTLYVLKETAPLAEEKSYKLHISDRL